MRLKVMRIFILQTEVPPLKTYIYYPDPDLQRCGSFCQVRICKVFVRSETRSLAL
jgi:hypothetical protein